MTDRITQKGIPTPAAYQLVAEAFRDRLLELIPEHPELLDRIEPPTHEQVEGLRIAEGKPSTVQRWWAWREVKKAFGRTGR